MSEKITIGADPELFIKKDDEIISAEGHIEGTKEKPFEIAKGYGLQLDNIACEFNIPPCNSFEEFNKSINFSLGFIKDKLKRDGLEICSEKSTHEFKYVELRTKNARQFGCSPDYDVYKKAPNMAPSAYGKLRTVAGHIHIGYEKLAEVNMENSEKIIKAFDLFVTVPSILTDIDKIRRTMYGRAGSFRFTDYGVEARALSNFWIFDKGYMKMVYDGTIMATKLALQEDLEDVFEKNEADIVKAINLYDTDIAKELIAEVITPFYEKSELITSLKTI